MEVNRINDNIVTIHYNYLQLMETLGISADYPNTHIFLSLLCFLFVNTKYSVVIYTTTDGSFHTLTCQRAKTEVW